MKNERSNLAFDSNEVELVTKALGPLHQKLLAGDTVAGTVELIDASLTLDPQKPYIDLGEAKRAPRKYIEKELAWYLSRNRCIVGHVDDVEIWRRVATDAGMVNSNYGWCVFSEENGDQYRSAVDQLVKSPNGRQSVCIYTRPSIQREWCDGIHAKHDFICTFNTQHFIRGGKLEYIVSMRSNDAIFGFINDFAWHCYVYDMMLRDLIAQDVEVEHGSIRWHAGSFHVYERHYDLLKKIIEEYEGFVGPTTS